MNDCRNTADEAGRTYPLVIAAAAIAFLAFVVMGGLTVRTLSAATPSVSAAPAAMNEAPAAYFPAQYVNQATEIEPMPPTF